MKRQSVDLLFGNKILNRLDFRQKQNIWGGSTKFTHLIKPAAPNSNTLLPHTPPLDFKTPDWVGSASVCSIQRRKTKTSSFDTDTSRRRTAESSNLHKWFIGFIRWTDNDYWFCSLLEKLFEQNRRMLTSSHPAFAANRCQEKPIQQHAEIAAQDGSWIVQHLLYEAFGQRYQSRGTRCH